jgi:hypothetical protein
MSGGACKPIETAADVAALTGEFTQLTARAALAAGYKVDLRNVRYEWMIYANGKHFHPFTNWEQCVRLIADTMSELRLLRGVVSVRSRLNGVTWVEDRQPSTDAEYRNQMCNAVVTNVAKGFPV